MSASFELNDLWQAIADGVVHNSDSFSRQWRILFHVRDEGSFLLDVKHATVRPVQPDVEADAAMSTNRNSLAALADGQLDPSAPQPGQVCILTGERKAWEELSAVLSAL